MVLKLSRRRFLDLSVRA